MHNYEDFFILITHIQYRIMVVLLFVMLHSHQRARAWKYLHACAHPVGAAQIFCTCVEGKVQICACARWYARSFNTANTDDLTLVVFVSLVPLDTK